MKKSKFLKKSLAMLLAVMLVVAMIPLSASAALPEGFDLSSIVLSETSNRNDGQIVDLGTGVNVKVSEKSESIWLFTNEALPTGAELRAKGATSTVKEAAVTTTGVELPLKDYMNSENVIELNLYDTTVSLNHVSATYTIKLEQVAGSTNTNIASVTADKGIYSATVDNVNKQIKVVTARHTGTGTSWDETTQDTLNAQITVKTEDPTATVSSKSITADNGDTFTVTSGSKTVTTEYTVVVTEYMDAFTSFSVNGVAGVFSDKNPFGYVDENGEYQGYDVYFARRLGEDLGVEINFVSTEAANRIEYLQTGKADVILANFTVTPERAEEVDFALPYMNVALGVISPDSNVITTLDNWNADDQMIVISGTTAETYLTKEYPDIPLQKYDSYATAKNALENGNGVAWANDNTEVIAFAKQNTGYTVGIPSLGSQDTIAPAVSQGNTTVLDWLNEEIKALGEENFFHKDYEETLVDTYGLDYEDELVVEGGETNA